MTELHYARFFKVCDRKRVLDQGSCSLARSVPMAKGCVSICPFLDSGIPQKLKYSGYEFPAQLFPHNGTIAIHHRQSQKCFHLIAEMFAICNRIHLNKMVLPNVYISNFCDIRHAFKCVSWAALTELRFVKYAVTCVFKRSHLTHPTQVVDTFSRSYSHDVRK